jgi:hypothetical protein
MVDVEPALVTDSQAAEAVGRLNYRLLRGFHEQDCPSGHDATLLMGLDDGLGAALCGAAGLCWRSSGAEPGEVGEVVGQVAMPIFTRARAMPMVRTNSAMRCFWVAKTCSMPERIRVRAALALALMDVLRTVPESLSCFAPASSPL